MKFGYESGPEGMAMSPAGEITWNVPASAAGKTHSVIVLVGDDSGQELYHTFRIEVDGPQNVAVQPNPGPVRPIPGVRPPVGVAQKFVPGTYRIGGTVIIFTFDPSGRFTSQSHGTGTWVDNGDGSILINRTIKFTYNPLDKSWRGMGALGGQQKEMTLEYLRP